MNVELLGDDDEKLSESMDRKIHPGCWFVVMMPGSEILKSQVVSDVV